MDFIEYDRKKWCSHCRVKRPIGPLSLYCSFRCCYEYGMKDAVYNMGPTGDCFMDTRLLVSFDGHRLHKRVAAWYVRTGYVVRSHDIVNTCTTPGCTNADHFESRSFRDQRLYEQDTGIISLDKGTLDIKMFVNGQVVEPRIEYPPLSLRPGYQKIRVSHLVDQDLVSLLIEIPERMDYENK